MSIAPCSGREDVQGDVRRWRLGHDPQRKADGGDLMSPGRLIAENVPFLFSPARFVFC